MIWTLNGYILKVSLSNHPGESVFETATYLCELMKILEKFMVQFFLINFFGRPL